jgi:hypothetical protein
MAASRWVSGRRCRPLVGPPRRSRPERRSVHCVL